MNDTTAAPSFTATIRKDFFPYFVQGRTITINGLDLYDGTDMSKQNVVGVPTTPFDLSNQFSLTTGVAQALKQDENAQIFLIIRYSLS